MEKINVTVLGLSASSAGSNAYALSLKEIEGQRRMQIIIGAFEAQAIALELEGVRPPRPMTHDLFKTFIEKIGSNLDEVYINDLIEGTFYAKLIFENGDIEIDCRPSDALAMAVRFRTPIYVNSDVINEIGILPDITVPDGFENPNNFKNRVSPEQNKMDRLQLQLEKAINEENYEKAASIRDEMKKILEN